MDVEQIKGERILVPIAPLVEFGEGEDRKGRFGDWLYVAVPKETKISELCEVMGVEGFHLCSFSVSPSYGTSVSGRNKEPLTEGEFFIDSLIWQTPSALFHSIDHIVLPTLDKKGRPIERTLNEEKYLVPKVEKVSAAAEIKGFISELENRIKSAFPAQDVEGWKSDFARYRMEKGIFGPNDLESLPEISKEDMIWWSNERIPNTRPVAIAEIFYLNPYSRGLDLEPELHYVAGKITDPEDFLNTKIIVEGYARMFPYSDERGVSRRILNTKEIEVRDIYHYKKFTDL